MVCVGGVAWGRLEGCTREATESAFVWGLLVGYAELDTCLLHCEEQGQALGRLTLTEVWIMSYDPGIKNHHPQEFSLWDQIHTGGHWKTLLSNWGRRSLMLEGTRLRYVHLTAGLGWPVELGVVAIH